MALDNSTIQHPLPGDLQARIENAQNQVTLLEAEDARLFRLISSKKGEVNSLHGELKSGESVLKAIKGEIGEASVTLSSKNEEMNRLNYAIKNANYQLEEANRQKIEITNLVATKTDELEQQIAQANANDEAIQKRHDALVLKEVAHQRKVDRLLEALK